MESPQESNKPELTKEERFKSDPERWVCLDDLIVAMMRTPKGIAAYHNILTRGEAIKAKGECDAILTKLILEIDIQMEMEAKGSIVPAKGGILNAARNRLFRK